MALPLRLLPVLVTVNRDDFTVRIYKLKGNQYALGFILPCAIGAVGHTTPAGLYYVDAKNRKPDWLAPNADWVPEEKRGKIFKFDDPTNPFLGGFISLAGNAAGEGIGFHGTKFDPQLGTRASHGCIRMDVASLDIMFKKVPMGTPVFIYGKGTVS